MQPPHDARGRSGSRSGPRSRGSPPSPRSPRRRSTLPPGESIRRHFVSQRSWRARRYLAHGFSKSGLLVVVPRPDLTIADGELHALDRPAVRWPEESLWFWQGLWIAESLATRRERLGPQDVFAERNLERRRVMVDVLGFENLVRAAGGRAGTAGRLRPSLATRPAARRRRLRHGRGRQLHPEA